MVKRSEFFGGDWFERERPANAFPGVAGWKLQAAFHLIGHDAVNHFGTALCVDDTLPDLEKPHRPSASPLSVIVVL